MGRGLAAAIAVGTLAVGSVQAQQFDNASVITLHQAGLGESAILAKIAGMPCAYDVSTNGLIALKRAGLSDGVIAAMVTRCSASSKAQGVSSGSANPAEAHTPGIYLMQDWLSSSSMQILRPAKASGVKVTGNGSILFPYVGRLVLPDGQSHNVVKSRRPTFYFYFKADDRAVSTFGTPDSEAAQSPNEFTLVQFKVKDGSRQVSVGRISGFTTRRGIDPKEAISFQSDEVGEAAFKVTVASDLSPGEYGFVITGGNGSSRVYDFTIS